MPDIEVGHRGYKEGKDQVCQFWMTVYWGKEAGKQVNYNLIWKALTYGQILGLKEMRICRNLSLECMRNCKTAEAGTTLQGSHFLGN